MRFIFCIFLLQSFTAKAMSVDLQNLIVGGNCEKMGVQVEVLEKKSDELKLKISLNQIQISEVKKTLTRKSCTLGLPIKSEGKKSKWLIKGVSYSGIVEQPKGLKSKLRIESFLASLNSEVKEVNWNEPTNSPVNESLSFSASNWSECGDSVLLRSNISLRARKSPRSKIEGTNLNPIKDGLVVTLSSKSCQ